MKYSVKLDADNRDINVAVSVKKEDGEPDFFENIGDIFDKSLKIDALPEGATDIVDTD